MARPLGAVGHHICSCGCAACDGTWSLAPNTRALPFAIFYWMDGWIYGGCCIARLPHLHISLWQTPFLPLRSPSALQRQSHPAKSRICFLRYCYATTSYATLSMLNPFRTILSANGLPRKRRTLFSRGRMSSPFWFVGVAELMWYSAAACGIVHSCIAVPQF